MTINNMKKKYISPETVVFVCNTNSLLMASTLDALNDDLSVILTEEELAEINKPKVKQETFVLYHSFVLFDLDF